MAKYDRMSSLFWIVFAIAICEESIRIGPGSLSAPGPGLLPLGCGVIIESLAIIALIQSFKSTSESRKVLWDKETQWGKLVSMLSSIIGYAFLLDFLGFLLVNFLWLGFVCYRVGKMRFKGAIFISVITTALSYIVFVHYLGIRLPLGVFRFLQA